MAHGDAERRNKKRDKRKEKRKHTYRIGGKYRSVELKK